MLVAQLETVGKDDRFSEYHRGQFRPSSISCRFIVSNRPLLFAFYIDRCLFWVFKDYGRLIEAYISHSISFALGCTEREIKMRRRSNKPHISNCLW